MHTALQLPASTGSRTIGTAASWAPARRKEAQAGADCAGAAPCCLATRHNGELGLGHWRRQVQLARSQEPGLGGISLQVKADGRLHSYPRVLERPRAEVSANTWGTRRCPAGGGVWGNWRKTVWRPAGPCLTPAVLGWGPDGFHKSARCLLLKKW